MATEVLAFFVFTSALWTDICCWFQVDQQLQVAHFPWHKPEHLSFCCPTARLDHASAISSPISRRQAGRNGSIGYAITL